MKTTTTITKKTKKPTQSGLSKTVAKGYKPHGVGEIKQEKKKTKNKKRTVKDNEKFNFN